MDGGAVGVVDGGAAGFMKGETLAADAVGELATKWLKIGGFVAAEGWDCWKWTGLKNGVLATGLAVGQEVTTGFSLGAELSKGVASAA